MIAALVGGPLLLASPALATTAAPGMLTAKDLPGDLRNSVVALTTTPTQRADVVDPATCTETSQTTENGLGVTIASFAAPGSKPYALPPVYESVTAFADAKAADAAFRAAADNDAAGRKCATVGSVASPGAAATSTFAIAAAQGPRIGNGAFASTSALGGDASKAFTTITFRSGPYIVRVMGWSVPGAPTLPQLATIATRAQKRLATPTKIPPATTTTTTTEPPSTDVALHLAVEALLTAPPHCSVANGIKTVTVTGTAADGTPLKLTLTDGGGAFLAATGTLMAGSTTYVFPGNGGLGNNEHGTLAFDGNHIVLGVMGLYAPNGALLEVLGNITVYC